MENCEHNFDLNLTHCNVCGTLNYQLKEDVLAFKECAESLSSMLKMMKKGTTDEPDFRKHAKFIELSLSMLKNKNIKSVLNALTKDVLDVTADQVSLETGAMLALTETRSALKKSSTLADAAKSTDLDSIAIMAMEDIIRSFPEDFKAVGKLIQWEMNAFKPLPDIESLAKKLDIDLGRDFDKNTVRANLLQHEFRRRLKKISTDAVEPEITDDDFLSVMSRTSSLVHFYISNTIVMLNERKKLSNEFIEKEYDEIFEAASLGILFEPLGDDNPILDAIKKKSVKSVKGYSDQFDDEDSPVSFNTSDAFKDIFAGTAKMFNKHKESRQQ